MLIEGAGETYIQCRSCGEFKLNNNINLDCEKCIRKNAINKKQIERDQKIDEILAKDNVNKWWRKLTKIK